jgi:Tol biopolymer transport system component
MANRSSSNEPFGKPVKISAGRVPVFPTLSKDGLILSFCSVRADGFGVFDLLEQRRKSTSDPFGSTTNLGSPPNSPHSDGQACYSSDGLTIIFCSDRPGGLGIDDFWTATRSTSDARFGTPVHLGHHLSSRGQDFAPTLVADDRILMFASTRPGPNGGFDIWMSVRPTKADPFGPPINLGPEVNSPFDEGRPSLSEDGKTLYFDSNRSPAQSDVDIWRIRRLPKGQ